MQSAPLECGEKKRREDETVHLSTDTRRTASFPRSCLCSLCLMLPFLLAAAVAHAGEITPVLRCPEPTAPAAQRSVPGPATATLALRAGDSGRSTAAARGAVRRAHDTSSSNGVLGDTAKGAAEVSTIMPGDTISVTVSRRPDLSCQVRVPREGNVMLPGAGAVRAAGRGAEELAREVARLLEARERLLEARVTVAVLSYGVRRAFVEGAVARPQSVDLPAEAELTLTQAVASCGGFAPDADRAGVRVTQKKRGEEPRVVVVDASRIAQSASPELDLHIEAGDTVYVPRREPVYVLGQVNEQGALTVPFEYPLTVSKAVAMSGGFTPYARQARVRVTRRTARGAETFRVDVGAILVGGDLEDDIELLPGDMVYVPERVF